MGVVAIITILHFIFNVNSLADDALNECLPPEVSDPTGAERSVNLAFVSSPAPKDLETEVLYSWQSLAETLEWAATAPKTQLFRNNYLYAWRTPAATFAYGDLPIRIKLKKGVKFVPLPRNKRECGKLPAAEKKQSVYYISLGDHTFDYLLCSHQIIESWSFGTPEIVEEVQRDINFVLKNPGQGDYYGDYNSRICKDCPFGFVDDQPVADWNESALDTKLAFLRKISESKLGRVFRMDDPSQTLSAYVPINAVSKTLYVDEELIQKDINAKFMRSVVKSMPGLEVRVVRKDLQSKQKYDYKAISLVDFEKLCLNYTGLVWVASVDGVACKNTVNFASPYRPDQPRGAFVENAFPDAYGRAKVALKGERLGLPPGFEYEKIAAQLSSIKASMTLFTTYRIRNGLCQKLSYVEKQVWVEAPMKACRLNL